MKNPVGLNAAGILVRYSHSAHFATIAAFKRRYIPERKMRSISKKHLIFFFPALRAHL